MCHCVSLCLSLSVCVLTCLCLCVTQHATRCLCHLRPTVCVCLSVCLPMCVCVCVCVCMSVCLCAAQRAIRHPLVSRTVPSETHAVAPAAAAAVADDDANRKIDWHDYAQIARDEQRTGTVAIYHSHHHHCHYIERGHSSHPSSTNWARRRLTLLIKANALPYAN